MIGEWSFIFDLELDNKHTGTSTGTGTDSRLKSVDSSVIAAVIELSSQLVNIWALGDSNHATATVTAASASPSMNLQSQLIQQLYESLRLLTLADMSGSMFNELPMITSTSATAASSLPQYGQRELFSKLLQTDSLPNVNRSQQYQNLYDRTSLKLRLPWLFPSKSIVGAVAVGAVGATSVSTNPGDLSASALSTPGSHSNSNTSSSSISIHMMKSGSQNTTPSSSSLAVVSSSTASSSTLTSTSPSDITSETSVLQANEIKMLMRLNTVLH